MRRYLSVLAVAARSTVYKLAGLLLLMAGVEAALFWRLLRKAPDGGLYALEELFRASGVPLVCAAAFLALCALLSLTGHEFSGSRTRYTIQRLSIREETTVLLWACHNMICLLIFWGAQLAVALLLCRWYVAYMDPTYYSDQTIFLAFYRSGFLHSLLPLEETSRYVCNAALILALGVAAACFVLMQRRGRRGLAVVTLAVATVVKFPRETGGLASDVAIALLALSVAAYELYEIFRGQSNEG